MFFYTLERDRIIEQNQKQMLHILLDLRETAHSNSSRIDHCHFLLGKQVRGQQITDEDLSVARLSDFVPCESYKELQELDRKLEDDTFFNTSVVENDVK